MQSFYGSVRLAQRQSIKSSSLSRFKSAGAYWEANFCAWNGVSPSKCVTNSADFSSNYLFRLLSSKLGARTSELMPSCSNGANHMPRPSQWAAMAAPFPSRSMSTVATPSQDPSAAIPDVPARIKFKRLDKTSRNIMQILDKEAVEQVKSQREIPDIRPGCTVQIKLEVPENKRRVSVIKGIVIARRNAGLNTTFRIRRLVAGVGVEQLFPLYSPNLKEIKVLDKKKVRRAKLYYLRDKMNALKKQ